MASEVVRVGDEHAEVLAGFFRQVWDTEATAEKVRSARAAAAADNPIGEGEDVPAFAFLTGGQVVGYVSTIPLRLWSAGVERPAHWLKGLMVLPEHRNGAIGFLLLREAVRHLGTAMATVVQPTACRLFEMVGFRDVGVIPNHLRVLDAARVLRNVDPVALGIRGLPVWIDRAIRYGRRPALAKPLGWAGDAALRAWSGTAGRGAGRGLRVSPELDPAAVDRAWARARDRIVAAAVRDGRALQLLWAGSPDAYRFLGLYEGPELVSYAVVRRPRAEGDPRLRDLRVATLSDLLFPLHRPDLGLAVLAAAERAAREMEADALLCSASHPRLRALLPRRAFVKIPGNVHLLARAGGGEAELPRSLDQWWLTRADSAADGAF